MNKTPHSSSGLGPRPARQVLQNLLRDLWRYKLVVPAVAGLIAGAVALYATRQPRIFLATATLEYDPNPAQPMGRSLDDGEQSSNYWSKQEFYETQNFVLKSRALAERVVRKLGLNEDPSFFAINAPARRQGPAVPAEAAAQVLQSRLKVAHLPDTRLVRIHVEDWKPERAQLVANTLAEAYMDKSLEDRLGTSARALEWLGGQMESLKRELEGSELALYRFREENQSLSASLGERQKIIASQLHSYNETLTGIRTDRIKLEARLATLRETLARGSDPLAIRAGPLEEDKAIADLRGKFRDFTTELEKLAITYGASHPLVQTARANQQGVSRELHRQMEGIIQGLESDLAALTRAEKGIQKELTDVNQQGLKLSLQETSYTRLDRERQSKLDLYNLVMERAAQTDLTRALRLANARFVDRALKPEAPIRPRVQFAVTLGIVLGLMAGIAAAIGIAQLDNKVRNIADLESRGVPALGVLTAVESANLPGAPVRLGRRRSARLENTDRDMIVHREPRSTVAECCRTIRTNLTFQSADRPLRAIAVTSAMPRDGKSTVAISLGITIAQSGRRVLLVDTDLRKPRLQRAFGVPLGAGVTSVIAGEASLEEAVQTTDVPGLTLLQCGPIPPNPSELLHTRRFAELLEEARSKFDMIIFDTPPLGAVTDPAIISTCVDGVIVVIRARSTTRAGVSAALRQLHDVSARVVGAVLNDVDLTDSSYGSYYSYYRGYYAEDEPAPPRGRQPQSST